MTTTKFAVDELMTKAFAPGRDPRSQEYKQAVLSILSLRIDGDGLIEGAEQIS